MPYWVSIFAILIGDLLKELAQGALVGGVSGQDFVGQRKTFRGDNESDDDLHAIATLVSAVAEATLVSFGKGRIAFEIGAREIVEEHFVFNPEEIAPALGKVIKERLLVGKQHVQNAVEIILGRERIILTK